MNNKGNIMINLLLFAIALGVMVAFIPVFKTFIDMAQQSDNLNCRGFIYNGNVNATLSFNSSLNDGNSGSPLSCLAIKLYLPYILLTFLVAGVFRLLYEKGTDVLPGDGE